MDMSENVVDGIANVLLLVALAGVTTFVIAYAFGSPWRSSAVGRTLMYAKVSMLTILSFAFIARWLNIPVTIEDILRLCTYAFLAFTQWRLFLMLRYVQKGLVTQDEPNYSPFKDWLRRRRTKKEMQQNG